MDRKTLLIYLYFVGFGLFLSTPVSALPVQYTFSGEVYSQADRAGIIWNAYGRSFVGDSVEYVFMVDTERDGEVQRSGGAIDAYADFSDSDKNVDYFYADLISGSLIDWESTGLVEPQFIDEYNYGESTDRFDPFAPDGTRLIGDSHHEQTLILADGLITDWVVGTQVVSFEWLLTTRGSSNLFSRLELTDISPVPVPAPPIVLLFGIGLAGLISVNRKKNPSYTVTG